jgi:hypothetical protein
MSLFIDAKSQESQIQKRYKELLSDWKDSQKSLGKNIIPGEGTRKRILKQAEIEIKENKFIQVKPVTNLSNKKTPKGRKRSKQKWENQLKISKKIFESISEIAKSNDYELIRDACVAFRNPVVFDNQVSEAFYELPYCIPGDKMVSDHLVGMSNIVLYIYKNKIFERWNTLDDFISTLRALQVLLPIPKSLNDKGSFKSWQFDMDNINECIKWYKKLQNENIKFLNRVDGELVPVMEVYNDWYENNKNYL